MHARTPLSSRAKPFTPTAPSSKAQSAMQVATWHTVAIPMIFSTEWLSDSTAGAQQSSSKYARGRTCSKGDGSRLPSRTPSPSGSVCISEASTTIASSLTKEDSFSDVSTPDLQESVDVDGLQVKNTFLHFRVGGAEDEYEEPEKPKKLQRSSSAPGSLLSCAFQINMPPSMQELHGTGECTPCAYFAIKADGCRRGSDCAFCHLCPADALKTRKKLKLKAMKEAKKERNAWQAFGAEFQ